MDRIIIEISVPKDRVEFFIDKINERGLSIEREHEDKFETFRVFEITGQVTKLCMFINMLSDNCIRFYVWDIICVEENPKSI